MLELSPIQLITICAIVNGLVFSILLLDKKENRKANRFLSLMILCLCFTFTPYMLDPSVWHQYRLLAWVPFSLSYWIGPSFYFYVRALTKPSVRFRSRELWHFSPLVLNYLHSFYHALSGDCDPYPRFHHLAELLEAGAIISILIYMVVSYRLVVKYQDDLLNRVSNLDLIDLRWVKTIIAVIALSFVMILIFLVISSGLLGKETLSQWDQYRSAVLLFYAAVLYGLSISGFRQAQTLNFPETDLREEPQPELSVILSKLQHKMTEDHLYRNPDLSLSDLSRATGVSERAISQTLNNEVQKNYYRFINEYRVEEVKRRLMDPKVQHLKILSVAFDAGFNSKASFNRVFKLYTGLTPKQFRTKHSA